jgi:hypothetical protein
MLMVPQLPSFVLSFCWFPNTLLRTRSSISRLMPLLLAFVFAV